MLNNLFELEAFKQSWLAGEKINYVREEDLIRIKQKHDVGEKGDFWLLDDRKVLLMHYDGENDFVGCEITESDVEKYAGFYGEVLAQSLPLPKVLARFRKNIKLKL